MGVVSPNMNSRVDLSSAFEMLERSWGESRTLRS